MLHLPLSRNKPDPRKQSVLKKHEDQVKALLPFFKGLESSTAIDGTRRGAIEAVEEIERSSFSPPQPVGFKSDNYSPPLQNPFCIFWKKLHKLGDKTVMIHSSTSGKKVIIFLGDRANIFVELFYKQLLHFVLPAMLFGLIVAATIYDNGYTDFFGNSHEKAVLRLIFFFYPNHVVFWNLLSILITFFAISLFLHSVHGKAQIRSGLVMSLQNLSSISGFHFMVSYNWDSKELALSVASTLAQLPLNVWMDIYRLENAHRLQATIYYTARSVLFVVVLLNPKYLSSVNCCIELIAVLRMPRTRSVFYIDDSFKWSGVDLTALKEALEQCGFKVVTSLHDLLIQIDERLLVVSGPSAAFIRAWWHEQPVSESIRLVVRRDEPRSVAGRDPWYSLRGRAWLPAGSVSTGLHYISADGLLAGEAMGLPFDVGLAALMLVSIVLTAVAPSWCQSCYSYVDNADNISSGVSGPTGTICTSCDGYFNIFQAAAILNIRVARQMLKRADVRVSSHSSLLSTYPPLFCTSLSLPYLSALFLRTDMVAFIAVPCSLHSDLDGNGLTMIV